MAKGFSREKAEGEENYQHENEVASVKTCECLEYPLTVKTENANNISSCEQLQVQTDITLTEEQNGDGPLEEEGNKVVKTEGLKPDARQEENGIYGDYIRLEKTFKHKPSEDGESSQVAGESLPFAPGSQGLENKQEQSSHDDVTKYSKEKGDNLKSSQHYSKEIPGSPVPMSNITGKLKSDEPSQTSFAFGQQWKSTFRKKRKLSKNAGRYQTKGQVTDHPKLLHSFPAGKRLWVLMFGLFMIVIPLPVHGAAASLVTGPDGCVTTSVYESGCSLKGSSREDYVLDAFDILDGDTFDGSSRNYSRVCSNAFHNVEVKTVYLQYNSLQDLPCGIFDDTVGLTRLYLYGNNFTDFPLALNSLTDLQLLDISDNRISVIPKGSMNGLKSLTSLYLSGNQDMEQVPEGLLDPMNNPSLQSVFLKNTKIQHPLVPARHLMVCTTDNPCNVTHRVGGVVVTPMIGNSVTFEITQNGALTCQELKEQLEADYEILNGSISCENNILGGSVNIIRKSKNGTETDAPTPGPTPGPTTGSDKKAIVVMIVVFACIVAIFVIVVVCKKPWKPEGNATPNDVSDMTLPLPHNNISVQETSLN